MKTEERLKRIEQAIIAIAHDVEEGNINRLCEYIGDILYPLEDYLPIKKKSNKK